MLKLHNTLTGKVEDFKPQDPNNVLIYSCGPTVYDYQHIGNLTAYIYWDILVRVLIANDYKINRVMNITDVGHLVSDGDEGEDKLEKGARREGKTAWEIAEFYTNDFIESIKKLNIILPNKFAKATDFIPQQLETVRQLKNRGLTYQIDDGIYYDTSKFEHYADFAHLDLKAQKAGARVDYNSQKRNPSDFALWKFSPTNETRDMQWETPLDIIENENEKDLPVMGFPGWHLECSTIAITLLGKTIDIHTGGIDHIPVHHTNEVAQSEAITGVKLSNFWLHNNFIKSNGTKISKSLGNGYKLSDLKEKGFTPLDFRMLIIQGNYKNESNFTFENLTAAKNRLHNWRNIAALRHQIHNTLLSNEDIDAGKHTVSPYATAQAILEALNDDLNTAKALMVIDEAFSIISQTKLTNIDRHAFIQLLESIDSYLGLDLIKSTPDISDEAKMLIIERKHVREQKDWQQSDQIRDELMKNGIVIKDNANQTTWEYKD